MHSPAPRSAIAAHAAVRAPVRAAVRAPVRISRADDVYAQLKRDVAEFKLVSGDLH